MPTINSVPRFLWDRRIQRALIYVALIMVWHLLARALDNPVKLPDPLGIVGDAWPLITSGELPKHIGASLLRIFLGYAAAMVVGLGTGIAMGLSRPAERILYVPIELLRPIPALAILPLLLVLVGIGDMLNISIVFYAAVFPIIVNTVAGIREVDQTYLDVATTLGARPWHMIREVILPAALPTILTGLRIGFQFAWMSIVGAELVGAVTGLGFMILYYAKFLLTENVMVGMVTIGILGFSLDRAMLFLAARLAPWQSA